MKKLPTVKLRAKKEIPIRAGHPWIFSNAVEHGVDTEPGALVNIISHQGEFIGIGMWNPYTSIRIRVISRTSDMEIDKNFFKVQFLELDNTKKPLLPPGTTGYRVVHADADYLPGLIIDRYGDVFVFQIHTAGMEHFRNVVVEALRETFKPKAIVERSDIEVRRQEGLTDFPVDVHYGKVEGPAEFIESGFKFYVDVLEGQKTGFYLDQRDARVKVATLTRGRKVLNLFGYTGAFGVYAIKGGAHAVTTIDTSRPALELAKKNFEINDINPRDEEKYQFIEANVFDYLSGNGISRKDFDFIICDPPAFAKSHSKKPQALEAYRSLNMKCFSMLDEGGILITSSCSGSITSEEFRDILRYAAGSTGRDARVLEFLGQPQDHTEKIAFSEGRYLKTVFLQVLRAQS